MHAYTCICSCELWSGSTSLTSAGGGVWYDRYTLSSPLTSGAVVAAPAIPAPATGAAAAATTRSSRLRLASALDGSLTSRSRRSPPHRPARKQHRQMRQNSSRPPTTEPTTMPAMAPLLRPLPPPPPPDAAVLLVPFSMVRPATTM